MRSARGLPSEQLTFGGRYVYDSMDFQTFRNHVFFINAEWGLQVDLIPRNSETLFRRLMENNQKKSGMAFITFGDILSLFFQKFRINKEDTKWIRFLDAESLEIVTSVDHIIFKRGERNFNKRNYIIKIGRQDLIKREAFGSRNLEQTIQTKIQCILQDPLDNIDPSNNVFLSEEMRKYVSPETFEQMWT
jgi:hypothetical protein